MTATHINGLSVVADEPSTSPLSTPDKPVHFPRIRELLLNDGSTWYGCRDCTETSQQLGKIRYHLRSHTNGGAAPKAGRTRKPRTAKNSTANPVPATAQTLAGLTLTELAARLTDLADLDQLRADVARIEGERDQYRTDHDELLAGLDRLRADVAELPTWRTRALTAEETLAAIRATLAK